jgi:branched-chain amino acid transport system permease protein
MDFAVIVFVEMLRAVAWLVLLAAGLSIIFGMMRVINIAHGEFLMLGGYTVVISSQQGVPLWIGILVLAPIVVGLWGILVERLIIRWLYGRMIDTLLATWGLSLLMIGGITMIFGNTTEGVSAPLGAISVGETYSIAVYNFVIIGFAALFLVGIYGVLKYTRWGLIARSVMQNPGMAQALGVNATFVYMATFGLGSALTGLAGGLLAPLTGVVPSMGVNFIGQAFITVVTGGAAVVAGTLSSAAALGTISQAVTFGAGPVYGDAALLVAALILLRILPQGITGRIFTRSI